MHHPSPCSCFSWIKYSSIELPIEVFATIASSILTWTQSKKHNELYYSYSLTLHEIALIRAEVIDIKTDEDFSDYVINCENAFSREYTQWYARKND